MTANIQQYLSPSGLRYAHLEENGRMAVIGYGASVVEAFEAAATALFDLVADIEDVPPQRTLPVSFTEADAAAALPRWLNLLLDAARLHAIAFSEFHLEREGTSWKGCATGDVRRRPGRDVHVVRAEQDSASVRETPDGWEARCGVQYRPPGAETPLHGTPGHST